MINLYEDQEEFVEKIREKVRLGYKSILGRAETGFGKTVVSAYITREASQKGKTVWFAVHRNNLLKQTSQTFWNFKIEHGQIASGKATSHQPVKVASIGTLVRRIDKYTPPDILILDECHLAMSKSWLKVVDWCKENGTLIIGNSATPQRLDGKGLDYIFDVMVEGKPMHWLIENKRLSDYKMFSTPSLIDLDSVKKRAGDYANDQLEKIMDKSVITGDALKHWKKYADGKRTIGYCVSINHSKHTAEYFNANGVPSIHVDGSSNKEELKEAINGFADGKYKVLFNVQLMTEGFDLSAQVGKDVPIEACIMLRPTHSLALYLQMVGRALRKKDNPAVILDHAGNVLKHGLPDQERDWDLKGKTAKQRKKEQDLRIKQCPKCYAVYQPTNTPECPNCGEVTAQKRQAIEQVDGDLIEVEKAQIKMVQKREQGAARGLEDLIKLGISRDMKSPDGWASHIYASRQGHKPSYELRAEAKRIYKELKR